MKFRLPAALRPFFATLLVPVVVAGGAILGSKIGLGDTPFITPDQAAHIVDYALSYIFLSNGARAVNAYVNPTNSATPALAESKPAAVIPKAATPDNLPHIPNDGQI